MSSIILIKDPNNPGVYKLDLSKLQLPTGAYDMFYRNASSRKIYVPSSYVNKYKQARYWSDYSSYIESYAFQNYEQIIIINHCHACDIFLSEA